MSVSVPVESKSTVVADGHSLLEIELDSVRIQQLIALEESEILKRRYVQYSREGASSSCVSRDSYLLSLTTHGGQE